MKRIEIILLLLLIPFFSKAQVILVVGSDTTAYSSINEALDNLSPNIDNSIFIYGGNFSEQVQIDSIGYSGYASSLYIRPVDTNTVNIQTTADFVIKINDSKNVRLERINLINNSGNALVISGDNLPSDNIDIIECSITGTAANYDDESRALVYISGLAKNIHFKDNALNGGSYSIFSVADTIDGIIETNVFTDFGYTGALFTNPRRLSIDKNMFNGNNYSDETFGIKCFGEASGTYHNIIKIQANRFNLGANSSNTAIQTMDLDTAFIANNMISITNGDTNVVFDDFSGQMYITFNNVYLKSLDAASTVIISRAPYLTHFVQNNIFKIDGDACFFDMDYNDLTSDYNLFSYDNISTFVKSNGNNYVTFEDWQNLFSQDMNSITGDPQFITSNDLHVQNKNLILGKGTHNEFIPRDFDNQRRKWLPDIGADEVNALADIYVTQDTIWKGNIYIDDTVVINPDVTLTIAPGTQIIFLVDTTGIDCYGNILAKGELENPIAFFSKYPDQKWNGINFYYNNDHNHFEHCAFFNTDGSALFFHTNSMQDTINYCHFESVSSDNGGAIFDDNSDLTINGCSFIGCHADNNGGAIYSTANLVITNSIFSKNSAGNTAADVYSTYGINSFNNTLYNSSAGNPLGQSIFSEDNIFIQNTIFWGYNSNDTIVYATTGGSMDNCVLPDTSTSISSAITPTACFSAYPKFKDTLNNDFHLLANSPCINKGTFVSMILQDFDGNPRPFPYSEYDIGAFEFQGYPLIADAGQDTAICADTIHLYAKYTPYEGTWSVIGGNADFIDIHDSTTFVKNLAFGTNTLLWTVTDGFVTDSDIVIITNNKPPVNAGEDISLISQNYPALITQTLLNADDPTPFTGTWTTPMSGITLADVNYHHSQVNGLQRGENIFIWTVINGGCANSDSVIVTSGFSFYPDTMQKGIDWNDPAGWNVSDVPTSGDSVTIYGTDVHITASDAECNNLVVSSSGNLIVEGTAKAPAVLHANKIYIEQTAEKFPNLNDTAQLLITNGTIYIDSASGQLTDGLVVGSMGQLVLDPGTTGTAEIHLANKRQLRVEEQAHFKSAKGQGGIIIRNGGKIYIEQTAEKGNSPKSFDKNVYIGTGGRIYIEQTAEKSRGRSELIMGHGTRIYIEQTAEKSKAYGGYISINGGRIYIEQTAEKGTKGGFNEITIGHGGRIYIEQTAEKAIDSSVLDVPRIRILDGGQLIVGTNTKNRANTGIVHANRIYIEQTAEKATPQDTVLLVNATGAIYISSAEDIEGQIYQEDYTAVSIENGGICSFADSSKYFIEENASFIDRNETQTIPAVVKMKFYSYTERFFASPFTNLNLDTTLLSIYEWNEQENDFNNYSAPITAMKGVKLQVHSYDILQNLIGYFNTGEITTAVVNTNQGINLIGNPYPSAINLDMISFPQTMQKTVYLYDIENEKFSVYQQGGLTLNGATNIIQPYTSFFVVASQSDAFSINNNARVHFFADTMNKDITNKLILQAQGFSGSDQTALVFDAGTDDYEVDYDALKMPALTENYFEFYSVSNDDVALCIDSRSDLDTTTIIPLKFKASANDTVTISVLENNLPMPNVFLYDFLNDSLINISESGSYNFIYDISELDRDFNLMFTNNNVEIKDVENNTSDVKIFAQNKTVFIVAQNNINSVQIFDIQGKKVFEKNINSKRTILQTNLMQGLYIVQARIGNTIFTKKIIIE